MSDEKLTWREALQALVAGEVLERSFAGGWLRMRMVFGDVQELQFWNGIGWEEDGAPLSVISACTWRRVPKTPRVHELPALWRERESDRMLDTIHLRRCAGELEAAIKEGELVSLKGVTAAALFKEFHASNCVHWQEFVLDYLRKRAVK
jgi:hypothetical protein